MCDFNCPFFIAADPRDSRRFAQAWKRNRRDRVRRNTLSLPPSLSFSSLSSLLRTMFFEEGIRFLLLVLLYKLIPVCKSLETIPGNAPHHIVKVPHIVYTNPSPLLPRPTQRWERPTTSLRRSSSRLDTHISVTTGPSVSSCTRC